ncbi:hypothetical protein AGMMS49992_26070 [Clostridia bacterium]|nr:hypothetical protein AGMMS49992_26070 [Clostridia bacterium]
MDKQAINSIGYFNICDFFANKDVGEVHFYMHNEIPRIEKDAQTEQKFASLDVTDAVHYILPYSTFKQLARNMTAVLDRLDKPQEGDQTIT